MDNSRRRAVEAGWGHVITLISGHGSPGRTTIAVGLAAALGDVAPTVLVDADTTAPSVAAAIDADPTRNVGMLAHALADGGLSDGAAWDRAITQEIQPIHRSSRNGWVLCGLPKPEMRYVINEAFVVRLVDELRRRYRYVVFDAGADLHTPESETPWGAITAADCVLLVTAPDVVGLLNARRTLTLLSERGRAFRDRLALVLNGYDRRYHNGPREVEWALQVPVAAVIPHDFGGVQAALAAQRPVVVDGGPAGRALLELAGRINQGLTVLPAAEDGTHRAPGSLWVVGERLRSWVMSGAQALRRRAGCQLPRRRMDAGAVPAVRPAGIEPRSDAAVAG